nr:MAG TPA: hypothetical protein [Caudoviricetes sp.]
MINLFFLFNNLIMHESPLKRVYKSIFLSSRIFFFLTVFVI